MRQNNSASKRFLESFQAVEDLERLRFFGRYCVDRAWLEHNYAEAITITTKTKKKFGMEPDEEGWIFSQIATQPNAQGLRAFCLTMRHAGLRISDATALNDQQLVQRASGKGYALKVFQKKTQEWVYVPIPDWVAAELQALPFRASKDAARYWFWTGRGELDTSINNWYRSISDVVQGRPKRAPVFEPGIPARLPAHFRHQPPECWDECEVRVTLAWTRINRGDGEALRSRHQIDHAGF